MALSEDVRHRVIGLCTGTIEPVTELEHELCNAYKQRVPPCNSIVQQWYEFVMQCRAAAATLVGDSTYEHENSQYAHSAFRESLELREARGDLLLLRGENLRLREIIVRQRDEIGSLLRRIKELEPPQPIAPIFAATKGDDSVGEICPICHGDGGAKGECYKCGGTGWLK